MVYFNRVACQHVIFLNEIESNIIVRRLISTTADRKWMKAKTLTDSDSGARLNRPSEQEWEEEKQQKYSKNEDRNRRYVEEEKLKKKERKE